MAESVPEETMSNNLPTGGLVTKLECAVCLQTCVHPAELPCGHIFCYLCIKGIVNQGRRCAMCRQDIPVDYLEKPALLNPVDAGITSQGFEDGHLWFYEGHNGWWQYDERTSVELESAYQKGERCCELLIAGFLYVADFDGMLQYRRNDPSRRRRIKRDLATTTKKGIAGLKATKNCNLTALNSSEVVPNNVIQNLPVSVSPVLSSLSSIRIFSSGQNHSNQQGERVQASRRLRGISLLSYMPSSAGNINLVSETNNSVTDSNLDSTLQNTFDQTIESLNLELLNDSEANSANSNLDSAIHDTLDWTIEQIESLNLELLNDYETLFRDVSNYGQLQDSLNQTQFSSRRLNNYLSRYLSRRNPTRNSLGISTHPTDAQPDPSHSSRDLNNLSPPPQAVSFQQEQAVYSEGAEIPDTSSLQSALEIPQPQPTNRRMIRSRSRGDSLRRSSSLNCDTLLQKFIPNK